MASSMHAARRCTPPAVFQALRWSDETTILASVLLLSITLGGDSSRASGANSYLVVCLK